MSYATVEQFRQYLDQIEESDERDADIQAVLDRAHSIVNDALGFSFSEYGETASDKDVRGQGGEWLWPPAYKAASVTGITRVSARGEDDESEEAVSGYVVDEDLRPYRIWRAYGWTPGAWYRVTAIWGYGPAPESIVEVELEVAVNIWRSRDAPGFTDAMGVSGEGGFTVHRALTWAQRSIIDGVRVQYLGMVFA